jgi:hypothetical protein
MKLTAIYNGYEFRVHKAGCGDIGRLGDHGTRALQEIEGTSKVQVAGELWADVQDDISKMLQFTKFLPCCRNLLEADPQPKAVADRAICTCCNMDIFRRPDGTWNLVYKIHEYTTICFIRNGQPDQVAFEGRYPHIPATDSLTSPASRTSRSTRPAPASTTWKKHPTFILYVVEHIGGDAKRKVTEFRLVARSARSWPAP